MNSSYQISSTLSLKPKKLKGHNAKNAKKIIGLKAASYKYLNLKEKYIGFWEQLNKNSKQKAAKRHAQKASYGTVNIKCAKRTMYLTLSDHENKLIAVLSTGHLKVKGKARRAIYFIKQLAFTFVKLILKTNKSLKQKKNSIIKKIHLVIQGYLPRRIKRIFWKAFKSQKKQFKICKLTRRLKTPHNGCRPRKRRRK